MKYAILLRGVNVGGHNKVPMAALRSRLEQSGCTHVRTYIQSGNIVLVSDQQKNELQAQLRSILQEHFEVDVQVQVFAHDMLKRIIAENPFSTYEHEEQYLKKLHVTFLSEPLEEKDKAKIVATIRQGEAVQYRDQVLYVWFAYGLGRSKLGQVISKLAYGTSRNWNTIQALSEL